MPRRTDGSKRRSKLLDLQRKWYDRLKSEGFDDIEDPRTGLLKTWHSSYFQVNYHQDTFTSKRAYFEMATDFLNSHPFSSEFTKEIWRLHTDGLNVRDIAIKLKDFVKRFPLFTDDKTIFKRGQVSKTKVHEIVQNLRSIMRNQDG